MNGTAILQHYPEPPDKLHNDVGKVPFILTECTRSFLPGKCTNGHFFVKAIHCGKEWCKECGQENSAQHKRRIAKWFGYAQQFDTMGYLVVTIPHQLRKHYCATEEKELPILNNEGDVIDKKTFYDGKEGRKNLSHFRTYIKRKLQRMGYKKGLIRYHWAGDCEKCSGKNPDCTYCKGTGAGREFKPHLNICIEEGYLNLKSDTRFADLKKDLATYFNNRFRFEMPIQREKIKFLLTDFKTLPASYRLKNGKISSARVRKLKPVRGFSGQYFYSYAKKATHKTHKIKYITRSTWRFFDVKICSVIKGFRTSSTWGKFAKPEVERNTELVSIVHGSCPCCYHETKAAVPIAWNKKTIDSKGNLRRKDSLIIHESLLISREIFLSMKRRHIDAGYFQIFPNDVRAPIQRINNYKFITDERNNSSSRQN